MPLYAQPKDVTELLGEWREPWKTPITTIMTPWEPRGPLDPGEPEDFYLPHGDEEDYYLPREDEDGGGPLLPYDGLPAFPGYEAPEWPRAGLITQFPLYEPYESPLLTETGEAITSMLRGEGVGIPEEAKQWQQAMGRITEAERKAEEAVTSLAARQGRMDSGLYAAEQMRVVELGLIERARTAEQFAIRSAEMEQAAKEEAIGMGIGYAGFRAEEATKTQQAAQHLWNTMVQLRVLADQQHYDWKKTLQLWEEQRAQIELGAEVAAPGFWDYFSSIVGSFLSALATGVF